MKGNQQPFVPNKKLILHFDVEGVLKLPNRKNKDLYVYDLCSGWVWGKLQKNSKEDPNKVTGWKLASNSLSKEQPQPDTITYRQYLKDYVKPDESQWENLILNLSKGPAAKAKGEIQKTIKNITIPKTLHDVLKENKQPASQLQKQYIESGKYEILPSFYKLFLNLKKNKREFAIVVKSDKPNAMHNHIIQQLNLFFTGEHPLYNGKNGTPLVKMDGTNKCKNFVFADSHFQVIYNMKHGESNDFLGSFGMYNYVQEKDYDMLKQTLKSNKKNKLCENIGQIYAYSHAILAQSAFIYEINPSRAYFIDEVDYLTQQIYFSTSQHPNLHNALGHRVQKTTSFFEAVDEFELLRDVDYFIKKVQKKQEYRAQEIQKIQKGQQIEQPGQQENVEQSKAQKKEQPKQSDADYLKRTIIPLLDGALRQVDLFRPDDPVGFVALYCLKNKERVEPQ